MGKGVQLATIYIRDAQTRYENILFYLFYLFFFFFVFLGLHLSHMEDPRLGVKSEPHL